MSVKVLEPHQLTMTLNAEPIDGQHKLNTSWTLWYDQPSNESIPYGSNTKEVYCFGTVENFWRMYNNIIKASDLVCMSSYYLFRKGIEPKWEDAQNKNGGRWIHYCSKTMKNEGIEEKWLNTILACIGEDFPSSELVKGCVFNCKKNQIRISLWVGEHDDSKAVKLIGSKFKSILDLDQEKIVFHIHQDSVDGRFFNVISL
ncbi:eukaryotic translation initiation factor 4E, putative [Entamoeba histolytica HM-1:IMSS-B]|uniref:Eukaryotic translation initiation factor 4E, putative n=6 Tax=Entamoeba histolytica TaxID=5759 RepID=C4M651_ENTH1|nr:eukaryotic translation initiation factor 4E, putative [Entamoeba histolytica HM-1:IMSS]EMD43583.1 eukaryotic translation initiation factor 4E, putative [Entamoeba histolytica KU27]EMH73573.1 eukaryotic translation initiation factor 4E, putative [Entamoeba histolytica HM-1:IMSS-B]EMS17643.1 eukaryotic translation initiation factor 4E, putative [Entamoeba histolytica HM-3:IMSS]ENY65402.1 eukaryotic translation initiation factor 4E, putative [Entamoeba histolytica HM-1:IMSS-A]GAT96932.1 eukary|eukprot:XP_655567.1 eukaryotic translation initiation factor 4E, putative [Entamoeba histolytica HM-1:IMSS]